MPRKRSEEERRQIGVYLEIKLIEKFNSKFEQGKAPYGAFTTLLNDLLRNYLKEKEEASA